MKIILDDRRYVPSNSPYNVVRNYEDCVEMIRLFRKIAFISLDYDLGESKTGLVYWSTWWKTRLMLSISISIRIIPWVSPK